MQKVRSVATQLSWKIESQPHERIHGHAPLEETLRHVRKGILPRKISDEIGLVIEHRERIQEIPNICLIACKVLADRMCIYGKAHDLLQYRGFLFIAARYRKLHVNTGSLVQTCLLASRLPVRRYGWQDCFPRRSLTFSTQPARYIVLQRGGGPPIPAATDPEARPAASKQHQRSDRDRLAARGAPHQGNSALRPRRWWRRPALRQPTPPRF